MASVTSAAGIDVATMIETIYHDGIVGVPNLLPVEWADALDEDLRKEFMAALSHEGGTAPRGWNRFYFEPYAEPIRATRMCRAFVSRCSSSIA